MNSIGDKKYTGDGNNEQRIFIKDARIGWRSLLNDPMKQLGHGIVQYEYLESLGPKLGGQARRLLDNYIDRWDYCDDTNIYFEETVTRETSRSKWRNFYTAKSVFDFRQIMAPSGVSLVPPDQLDDPIAEPPDLDEFLTINSGNFSSSIGSLCGRSPCLHSIAARVAN